MSVVRYFHGGPRGLIRILPPSVTGAKSTSDMVAAGGIHDRSKIYVTTDAAAAVMYAAGFDHGCVYEVEPVNLQPDPDCSLAGLSFACDACTIVRVHRVRGKALKRARKTLLEAA